LWLFGGPDIDSCRPPHVLDAAAMVKTRLQHNRSLCLLSPSFLHVRLNQPEPISLVFCVLQFACAAAEHPLFFDPQTSQLLRELSRHSSIMISSWPPVHKHLRRTLIKSRFSTAQLRVPKDYYGVFSAAFRFSPRNSSDV
jgi:hypothetical protein